MTIKQETGEALMFLESAFSDPRYLSVLQYARKNGLESETVLLLNGECHSAASYAMHICCNADKLGILNTDSDYTSYMIVSLLVALEAIRKSNGSYGTKVITGLRKAGIRLNRAEVVAFIAQEGTFDNNENKYALMVNNPLAVSIYCGELLARYNTLPGLSNGLQDPYGESITALTQRKETDMMTIEYLIATYVAPLFGEQNKGILDAFISWIRRTDYYCAPSCTDGLHNEVGGLASETVATIGYMLKMLLPATANQIGEIVLAAVIAPLYKLGTFHDDGRGGYDYYDPLPLGKGRKSVYIAGGFLGQFLPDSVAEAVDAHMLECSLNRNVYKQIMEYPLGLFLHIGTFAAALLQGKAEPAKEQETKITQTEN